MRKMFSSSKIPAFVSENCSFWFTSMIREACYNLPCNYLLLTILILFHCVGHGNWTEWSKWSFCSESCGGGITIRERTCDNPAPYNGGDDCPGSNNETNSCNNQICSGKLDIRVSFSKS